MLLYREWVKFAYFERRNTEFPISVYNSSHYQNLQIYTHSIAYHFVSVVLLPLLYHLYIFLSKESTTLFVKELVGFIKFTRNPWRVKAVRLVYNH